MSRSRFRFCPRVFGLGELDTDRRASPRGPDESATGSRPGPRDVELFDLARRISDRPGLVLLDPGADSRAETSSGPPSNWSVLAFDPLPGFGEPASLAELRERLSELRSVPGDPLPLAHGAFRGGFIGGLAYDLGVAGEALELPRDPLEWSPIVGGLYTDFVTRDVHGNLVLVLGDEPGDGRASVEERHDALVACFSCEAPPLEPVRPTGPLRQHTSDEEFAARIEHVRGRIAAGDLYQANLSQRFSRPMSGHPLELYGSLRRHHPAPFAAFLCREGEALLSASPELLLELSPGSSPEEPARARTRPIKGTIARGLDPVADRAAAKQLQASSKDVAELAMIVDLERNDLGRVARIGSVAAEGFPRLESYANVHHLLADVHAEVRPDVDAFDVLAALFPGGSITGAPKLASMELIADLEGEGRGFAYGALGYVDLEGSALLNILIRSLTWRSGEVTYRVGGGITWASDAQAEVRESWTKGERLADSLEG